MTDWRAELEWERHTRPSPPPADASAYGPTLMYDEWVRQRSCSQKRPYKSKWQANEVVLNFWKRGQDARVYKCRYGDHWHITTKSAEEATDERSC